jgi:hypothetical protein
VQCLLAPNSTLVHRFFNLNFMKVGNLGYSSPFSHLLSILLTCLSFSHWGTCCCFNILSMLLKETFYHVTGCMKVLLHALFVCFLVLVRYKQLIIVLQKPWIGPTWGSLCSTCFWYCKSQCILLLIECDAVILNWCLITFSPLKFLIAISSILIYNFFLLGGIVWLLNVWRCEYLVSYLFCRVQEE